MTVLLIIHSVTPDTVISAVNAITATMELTEPVVRVGMDIPLERAEIARVLLQQLQVLLLDRRKLQVMCCINVAKLPGLASCTCSSFWRTHSKTYFGSVK